MADPKVPDFMREFDDAKAARRNIYSNTLEAMKKRFPMEDDNYRLELNDLEYDGPQEFSLAEQKKALLNNRNLRTNLVGTWRLVDKKTGQVLDERRQSVMQVPYWTDRGTIINNGSEYTVISQSRLRPGVYARRKSNGEFEAQFNIRPGTGRAFHIGLQPETGVMTLQTGQGSVPLYQILKGLGVDDKQIVKYWGADVALANSQKVDSQAWNKLYRRMAGYKAVPNATEADKIQFIKDAVGAYEVDPEVVERTMGLRNVSTVTPELLLRASQKVLNVSRGDEKPDNRDNPRFSKFYGVEDYFKERVEKNAGRLANTLLWKAKRNGNLKGIQRNALNPWVDTIINGSGLAMPGEEANPLSTLEQMSRISKFGLGGIGSKDAVTMEARDVQGDYLGFVDMNSGPESEAVGVDVRASYRTFLGKDNKLYGELINNQTGKKEFVDIATAADRLVAFPGQDMNQPYVMAIKDGIPQKVPRDEVRYTVPSYGHMITSNTNMNIMPTGVQPTRQFYGSKFWSQYLPQAKGELPLVDSLMPDGKTTWSEYYGRKVGSLRSDVDGVVTKVDDDMVTIKGNDGKVYKKELVKNLPFNRLSSISYFPAVEVGQEVKAGDMVAHSNFTDKKTGAINMGQNMHVALLPWMGRSYEDAYTISEDAAKRLATDRLYSFDHDTRNGVTIGKNKYISAFPSRFTKEQVETLDENGVVKPGTVLHRGDPVVLSLGPKVLSSQDKALGKLSKALRNSYVDRSEIWEHDYPGKVVDTAVTSKGAKVNVSAQPPVRVGDKLAPFSGLKGVVGHIIPMDQMPRDKVTNQPYDILVNPMGFLSRVAANQLMAISLGKVAKATGKQIRIPQLPPPEGWYRWTQAQMKAAGIPETADVFDPVSGKTIKGVGDGYMYTMAFHHLAEKKASAVGNDGSYTQDEQPAKGGVEGAKKMSGMDLWAMLAHNVPEVIKDAQIIRGTCFDASTEVLTRNGWKNWDRVTADDELFTKEKFGDGQAWYEKPLQLVRYQYDGDLYGYENKHLDWLVTPDHNLWGINCLVSKKKPYRRYRLFKAANIFGKEGVIDAFGQVYAGSIPSSHVLEFTRESIGANRAVKDVRISLFDYCSFMGWWLSEGFANFDGGRGNIYISQDAYVHPAEFNEIRNLGRRMGLGDGVCLKRGKSSPSFKFTSPVGTYDKIRWRSKPLAQHLLQFGNSAWTKRIPDIIFEAPLDCRLEFLRTYILGDGCERVAKSTGKSPGGCVNWYIGTTSPTLAEDLQRLALISGFSAWYGIDKRAGEYNYKHDYYGVRICKGYTELTIRKHPAPQFKGHYTQSYCGPVFCATMSTGLLYVRRNGKCMWSGNCNSDYWRALQLGLPIPEPEEPFIYKKFLNTLRAGGINVTEKGAITKIMPQTDKDIDQLAQGRVITSSDMVDPDFEPMKGGLFDLGKTGGMGGNQWSMIQLPEPVPNPIMEEPVRRVLGLTVAKMEDILAGREKLNGKTGGQALKDALAAVNVDQKLAEAKKGITSLRGQKRDDAVKIYRYLSAMKEQGLKPQDWMVSKVPVLPPAFRPVSKMGDVALVSDMNELYKDILENAKNFEELRKDVSDDGLADERLDIYNSVKAAYGLGEPITPENAAKGVKGAIKQVIGSRPKFGMFQSKVTSKAVNGVARGVISPDPNLDMDQCGIPDTMAWSLYKPYIMRELVRNGYPTVTAIKMIADKTDTAKSVMQKVMEQRPVILDRAPTWHKFNLLAFRPVLTEGNTIKVSPLITAGFTADFDGDQMNAHVPSSEKAVQQAYNKMLPSRNLTSLTDLNSPRHTPSKEQIFGLYALTKGMDMSKPVKVFNSVSEAKQAYARGEIGPNDPIDIRG